MQETPSTVSLGNTRFRTYAEAKKMRAFLSRSTSTRYEIVENNSDLEFRYMLVEKTTKPDICFRQAIRGFLPELAEIFIGAVLILFSHFCAVLSLAYLGIDEAPGILNINALTTGYRYLGMCVGIYGLRCVYKYWAALLVFEDDGVLVSTGIIAKDQVRIRYRDIKTISVHQSILDRILGIGSIQLDSAGNTDGIDIKFKNLNRPNEIRARIQLAAMNQAGRD